MNVSSKSSSPIHRRPPLAVWPFPGCLPHPPLPAARSAYQSTDITNAQLGAASSRTVGISNTGIVAGIYDINGPGIPPFTAYLYDIHSGAVTDVNYQTANGGGPEFDFDQQQRQQSLGRLWRPCWEHPLLLLWRRLHRPDLPDPAGIPNNVLQLRPQLRILHRHQQRGALTGYFSADGGASEQSFLFANGQTTIFSDPDTNAVFTEALGINASGTIAGTDYNADFSVANGFLRAADGTFTLFDVPGAINTYLQGTSDNGNLFGFFETPAGQYLNFTDLNGTLIEGFRVAGSADTEITGINDTGEISGFYRDSAGNNHSFYAAPVPEADTTVGLGLGLPILATLGLRRRRKVRA